MFRIILDSIVPTLILLPIVFAISERKDVFSLFISGVIEGLKIVINISPYIIAIMVAMGIFTQSGVLDFITSNITPFISVFGIDKEIIPIAILRPVSGGATIPMLIEIYKKHGTDSEIGRLASVIMGSTETTFYTIAVYFGAIGIKDFRGTILAGVIADIAGIVTAIILVSNGIS